MRISTPAFATGATLAGVLAVAAFFSAPRGVGEAGAQASPPETTPAPGSEASADTPDESRQLFRPEDLVLLEGPDRAVWQQPDLIMDALKIADGSRVADVGAGAGWFTIRLARRVEQNGTVYAQDLQHQMVAAIARRVQREDLRNVRVVQGQENSPNLPAHALDAVLVVDVYPEVSAPDRVRFLQSLAEALKLTGRIGIVNYKPGGGGPGPLADRRVSSDRVEADARQAGLHVLDRLDLRYQYLIVLGMRG